MNIDIKIRNTKYIDINNENLHIKYHIILDLLFDDLPWINNKYYNTENIYSMMSDINNIDKFKNKYLSKYLFNIQNYFKLCKNPIIYEPVNINFIPGYIFFNKYIKNTNNIQNVLCGIPSIYPIEVLEYINQINNNNKINYDFHIYYDRLFNYIYQDYENLKKVYNNNEINIKNITEPILNIELCNNYINQLKKNYDLVTLGINYIRDDRKYTLNILSINQLYFNLLYCHLKVLKNGGKMIISFRYMEETFVKEILFILKSMFKKIKFDKITYYGYRCILFNYNKNNFNPKLFEEVINKMYEINKTGGFNVNFKDKEIREKYGFRDWDKNDTDEYIYSLFDINYNDKYNKWFDKVYEYISRKNKYKELYEKFRNKFPDCDLKKCLDPNNIFYICNQNLEKTLPKNISLIKEARLVVKQEYIYDVNIIKNKMMSFMQKYPRSLIYTIVNFNNITPNNININYTNEKKINKYIDVLKKNNDLLKILQFSIDTKDKNLWSNVTEAINIRYFIVSEISKNYNIKSSRGFIKMFEILTEFPLINFKNKKTTCFHICEAPGNFINATNYFIKMNDLDHEYEWYANSLNPNNPENKKKYGNAFGDSYGFMGKYKNKWLWGDDDTGDITKIENIEFFSMFLKNKIDLFTSDCGISYDVSSVFGRESDMNYILLAQTIISLLTTKIGGHCVVKIWLPMKEEMTLSIVYLYYVYFEKINIIKQSAGSLGSAEVYLVAESKKFDLLDNHKEKLFNILKNYENNKTFITDFSDHFLSQLATSSNEFLKQTTKYIYRSHFYLDNQDIFNEHKPLFEKMGKLYAKFWFEKTNIKKLDKKYYL
jgi:hypothetical protein